MRSTKARPVRATPTSHHQPRRSINVTETDARTTMQAVLSSQPDLQDFGFGAFAARRKTAAQIKAEIEAGRARMLEPVYLEQFDRVRQWLRRFPKIKRFNHAGTSYGLKGV